MFSGKKILLVDDEPANLELMVNAIESIGQDYEIIQALSGLSALNILRKETPDLIITDWEMPEFNGIDFISTIKMQEKLTNIPIIMCTGVMTSPVHLEKAIQAGAIDFIRKPFDNIELRARISSMLKLSASYKEIRSLIQFKDQIMSIIAHDLKSPIGGIKYILEVLLNKNLSENIEEIKKDLELINTQAGHTYNLLLKLLEWSNMQQNSVYYNPFQNKIQPLTNEAIKIFALELKNKRITIKNEIPEYLSAWCDPSITSSVIRNLLSNAIKYSFQDSVIRIIADESADSVVISIVDYGKGMTPSEVASIKNGTYINKPGTLNESGTGIGLKLVIGFLALTNSQLKIESELNKGSIMSFSLPSNMN